MLASTAVAFIAVMLLLSTVKSSKVRSNTVKVCRRLSIHPSALLGVVSFAQPALCDSSSSSSSLLLPTELETSKFVNNLFNMQVKLYENQLNTSLVIFLIVTSIRCVDKYFSIVREAKLKIGAATERLKRYDSEDKIIASLGLNRKSPRTVDRDKIMEEIEERISDKEDKKIFIYFCYPMQFFFQWWWSASNNSGN